MWNYIFFMAYLAQRDETDYTSNEVRRQSDSLARDVAPAGNRWVARRRVRVFGPVVHQAYVKAKMDEQDNSWFPIARAMCLQQSSDEMQERLQRIEDVLKAYVGSRIGACRTRERGLTRRFGVPMLVSVHPCRLHDRFKEEDRRRQQEEQRKRQEEGFEEARDV